MGDEINRVLCDAKKFALDQGVTCASYRIVPSFHSQLDPKALLFHFGFPENWVSLYDGDPEFRLNDPIADYVIRAGVPMTWNEAIAAQKLSAKQLEFCAAMQQHGLVDGIAAPIYGPHGREAYVTFSWGRPFGPDDSGRISQITAYATTMHNRIALLTESTNRDVPTFSARENEVLTWIARGKSNSDIAAILGVSEATVNTYATRLFRKLGVHNRMAATLMGLRHGLIRL